LFVCYKEKTETPGFSGRQKEGTAKGEELSMVHVTGRILNAEEVPAEDRF
jgi:hypothetical protein